MEWKLKLVVRIRCVSCMHHAAFVLPAQGSGFNPSITTTTLLRRKREGNLMDNVWKEKTMAVNWICLRG